jgi:hypothetical protein
LLIFYDFKSFLLDAANFFYVLFQLIFVCLDPQSFQTAFASAMRKILWCMHVTLTFFQNMALVKKVKEAETDLAINEFNLPMGCYLLQTNQGNLKFMIQ